MSLTSTDLRYVRRVDALWRDTGIHVLALPAGEASEVVVLGGGGALLWRLLTQPMSLQDVLERLGIRDDAATAEIGACLEDLAVRGLVDVTGVPAP